MIALAFPAVSAVLIAIGYARIVASRERAEQHVRHAAYASLFFLAVFLALATAVALSGRASMLDHWIQGYLERNRDSSVLALMNAASSFFDPLNFFVFAAFFEAALFVRRHTREAVFSSASLAFAFLLDWSAKLLVASDRPFAPDAATLGWSFPSGHTTLATAFFLGIYLIVRHYFKDDIQKVALAVLAVILSLIVGLSRLYLGLHWFSDVVGGLLLGAFAVFFVYALHSIPSEKRKR